MTLFWVVFALYVVVLAAVAWWFYLKLVFVRRAEEGLRERERWKAEHPDITEPNDVIITNDSGVTRGRIANEETT